MLTEQLRKNGLINLASSLPFPFNLFVITVIALLIAAYIVWLITIILKIAAAVLVMILGMIIKSTLGDHAFAAYIWALALLATIVAVCRKWPSLLR